MICLPGYTDSLAESEGVASSVIESLRKSVASSEPKHNITMHLYLLNAESQAYLNLVGLRYKTPKRIVRLRMKAMQRAAPTWRPDTAEHTERLHANVRKQAKRLEDTLDQCRSKDVEARLFQLEQSMMDEKISASDSQLPIERMEAFLRASSERLDFKELLFFQRNQGSSVTTTRPKARGKIRLD